MVETKWAQKFGNFSRLSRLIGITYPFPMNYFNSLTLVIFHFFPRHLESDEVMNSTDASQIIKFIWSIDGRMQNR